MKAVNPGSKMPEVRGIYAIVNKLSGYCYVGATQNLRRRTLENLHALESGGHHNDPLQKDWRRFGGDNFEFRVLEVESESLKESEQCWIDQAKRNHKCYNKNPAGGTPQHKEFRQNTRT